MPIIKSNPPIVLTTIVISNSEKFTDKFEVLSNNGKLFTRKEIDDLTDKLLSIIRAYKSLNISDEEIIESNKDCGHGV